MKKWFSSTMFFFLMLSSTACSSVEIGERQSEQTSIPLQQEQELDVSIRLGAGDLTLAGDTSDIATMDFVYNVEALRPIIDYEISDTIGQLSISQNNMNKPLGSLEGLEYKGNVLLNKEIPTKLYIKTGAGSNHINLRTIHLSEAEIVTGVGQTTILLDGDYDESFEVNIESGVGSTEVVVPKDVGVKIFVNSGVGQVETEGLIAESKEILLNEAYENTDIHVDVKIQMGVGNLKIVEGE